MKHLHKFFMRYLHKFFMKPLRKSYIIVITFVLAIFTAGIMLGWQLPNDNRVINNSNITITFIITVVGFIFSMITFFAIDAVDKKNRMDDNVLESQTYTVAYNKMLSDLNVESQEEFEDKLESIINKPKLKSCMQFAEWIQNIINHIVFFAYYNWKSEDNKEKVKNLKDNLEKQLKRYEDISSGVKIVLTENVELIKRVLDYQCYKANESTIYNTYSSLEDVRGKMMSNPIAQIVYYDYLGLDYRAKASAFMKKNAVQDEFSKDYFNSWKNDNYIDEKEKCKFILQTSQKKFEKALGLAEDDLLWSSYISYNLVRVKIMGFLLQPDRNRDMQDIKDNIEQCVNYRKDVLFMFSKESGYLKEKFESELKAANELKENFLTVFCDD